MTKEDERHLERDVRFLAAQPRHRDVSGSMQRSRSYCAQQLTEGGWTVTHQSFSVPNRLRIPDQGKPAPGAPLRLSGRVSGVNLIATRPGPGRAPGELTPKQEGLLPLESPELDRLPPATTDAPTLPTTQHSGERRVPR